MWSTWKAAIRLIAQEGGELRQKLEKWNKLDASRRYEWTQDGQGAFIEQGGEKRRHKIVETVRRKATIDEFHLLMAEGRT